MKRPVNTQITDPDVGSHVRSESELESLFRILIHNDDVTPYDYVILVLGTIFNLSHEMAEHITWVAHTEGIARVVTRPLSEAERLVSKAHAAARLDGFPLTFSLEPED
jgi:ATP-dependent Clp protease adaptor protein ClpS